MMLEALPDTTTDALRTALRAVLASLEAALKELEQAMATLVTQVAPTLLTLKGIGVVLAGTVLAEVGEINRFENVHHLPVIAALPQSNVAVGRIRTGASISAAIGD